MSFQKWNQHRLHISKTSHLIHLNNHQTMQDKLNFTIREINKFIIRIKEESQMMTPFLHSCVHKSEKRKIRYMYSKLIDGVHPTHQLSEHWKNKIYKVMIANEVLKEK